MRELGAQPPCILSRTGYGTTRWRTAANYPRNPLRYFRATSGSPALLASVLPVSPCERGEAGAAHLVSLPEPAMPRASGASSVPKAVQDCHELLAWLIPHLDKFPRARRFTLGERLESGLLGVLEALVEVAFSKM